MSRKLQHAHVRSRFFRATQKHRKGGSYHFCEIGGRFPAGLGNEIFNYSKANLGNEIISGKVISPRFGKGLHDHPDFLKSHSTWSYKLQLLKSRILRNLLVIDDVNYLQAASYLGNYDYREVFSYLIQINPSKKCFLHKSGMTGGYLSIQKDLNRLRKLIGEQFLDDASADVISFHIRGPVYFRHRFWQKKTESDFAPEPKQLTYGNFNTETPTNFYLGVIEALAKQPSLKNHSINIVTNMNEASKKIQTIATSLRESGFKYRVINGTPIEGISILMNSRLIVPSVSSYSLLAIFLSNEKYLWPRDALFESDCCLSIWGYQEGNLSTGPTSISYKHYRSTDKLNIDMIRGLPFPAPSPDEFSNWLTREPYPHPKWADLIYYGVVPTN